MPQFFSKRWGDDKCLLSAIAALVIIIFFIPYTASGFSACGKLFSSLFSTENQFRLSESHIFVITIALAL